MPKIPENLKRIERDEGCTCLDTCDDVCIGYCGCIACYHSDASPYKGIDFNGPRCEFCGRLLELGHTDDCELLGGIKNLQKDQIQRTRDRVKELKREISRLEGELP